MAKKLIKIVVKSYGTIITINEQGPITTPFEVTPEEMYSIYREGHSVTIYEGGVILDVTKLNIDSLVDKYKIDVSYFDANVMEFRRLSDFVNNFKDVKDIATWLYNKFTYMDIDTESRMDKHILAPTFIYLEYQTLDDRDNATNIVSDTKCHVIDTKCWYNYNGRHWELIYYGDNFDGGDVS